VLRKDVCKMSVTRIRQVTGTDHRNDLVPVTGGFKAEGRPYESPVQFPISSTDFGPYGTLLRYQIS
jgi:hypothetical protein